MKEKTVSVSFMLMGILFCVCLISANLLATKQIMFGPFNITAGILVFPISYIVNDCIVEVWGFNKAKFLIWTGFLMNFLFVFSVMWPTLFRCAVLEQRGRLSQSVRSGSPCGGSFVLGFPFRLFPQCLCDERDEGGFRRASLFVACRPVFCGGRNSRFPDLLSDSFGRPCALG